jgi:Tol biopolymer transport system component
MTMTRIPLIAASATLLACSPAVWRPLSTTEAATELSQVTRTATNELDPSVSPDASAIAYEVAASPDAPPRIEVMSLDGVGSGGRGAIEYSSGVVTGVEPAWRPDGSGLVFLSPTSRTFALMEMTGRGAGRPPLVADAGEVAFAGDWPAVSPDGSTIAMSLGSAEVFHTGWRAARHFDHALGFSGPLGEGFRVSGEGTEPAWSPDGRRLAFVRVAGGRAHLFVAESDGTGARQITEGPADDDQPSWSPDAQHIVFCSRNVTVQATQADLFTVRPDGSGLVQLTEGDRYACHPTWGRDGFIYFHANATDRFHVWRLRPGAGGTSVAPASAAAR